MGLLFKLVILIVILNLAWTYYYKPNYVASEKCPVCNGEGSVLEQSHSAGGIYEVHIFSRKECTGCYGKKLLTMNEKKAVDERRQQSLANAVTK